MQSFSWAGRKLLVTGGMGFIGSNLARRLAGLGAKVTVLDNLDARYGGNRFNLEGVQTNFVEADQRNDSAVAPLVKEAEAIFNLVGQVSHVDSMEDPRSDLETNVVSHISLLEACRRHNPSVKIVFCGTRGQYGRPEKTPVDEQAPLQPVDVNGINKTAGEMYHFLYARSYGLKVSSLRLTNTYGPRHTMKTARQGVFAWFVRQALDGEEIRLYGGGEQVRDFNHVEDVVDALLLAMTRAEADGQVFNLGSREPASLLRCAELIVRAAGRGAVRKVPYPDSLKTIEVGDYVGDYSKIQRLLGWEPKIALEAGVRETVAFYAQHRERYWQVPVYP
jgi:nucleoside-diphosphate-sugar epimerase